LRQKVIRLSPAPESWSNSILSVIQP